MENNLNTHGILTFICIRVDKSLKAAFIDNTAQGRMSKFEKIANGRIDQSANIRLDKLVPDYTARMKTTNIENQLGSEP